jgi:hypothetical protein
MASSSKGRASSRKQSSAGKALVIATKRKDALPRTASVSAGRRKPIVLPPIDALAKPPATAVAAPRKKARRLHQKEPTASRKKTTRAAGRDPAKLDEVAAMEIEQAVAALVETTEVAAPAPVGGEVPAGVVEAPALIAPATEPAMVTALEPVADTVVAVEPPPTAYEEFAVTTPAMAAVVPEMVEVAAAAPVDEEFPAGLVETPAAIAPPIETAKAIAPEPVADDVGAVEPPATAYDLFAVTPLKAPETEAVAVVAIVETELEVEASAIVEELSFEAVRAPRTAIRPPPIPEEILAAPPLVRPTAERRAPALPARSAPHHERRSLMPAISRLLSTLYRWTGVSGTK